MLPFHTSIYYRFCLSTLCTILVMVAMAHGDTRGRSLVTCDIQEGPCTQLLNGRLMTFDIQPKPVRAMEDLTFVVTIEGLGEDIPARIELNMLAMDMGRNHVPLKLNGQGQYEGRGVIVRCRTGIRTWSAKVVFADMGATEFIFDVIY